MLLQRQTIEKINQRERERELMMCATPLTVWRNALSFALLCQHQSLIVVIRPKTFAESACKSKLRGPPLTNIRYASMSHKTSQCQIQIGQLERGYELAFQGYRTHVEGHTYIWRDAKIKNPNL